MKRLFAALLSLVLALLLMGCSSAPANDPTPGQADAPVEDKTDPPAGEPRAMTAPGAKRTPMPTILAVIHRIPARGKWAITP